MQSSFREGWESASGRFSEFTGAFVGDRGGNISKNIQILQDDINAFKGDGTGVKQLSGDVAEFWHGNTANINAALKGSSFKVTVDRSHGLASPDLTTNTGDLYGLKYLRDAHSSSKAQATSYFERFNKYRSTSKQPDLSFQEYLALKGIPEGDILHDPIYEGQIRIIPADQYDEAVSFLKRKIADESMKRPEQVKRYQDALNTLQKVVRGPDGVTSAELSKMDAEEIARLAKEGNFKAYETEFVPADLIKFQDIVGQGLKAGATAAIITFVMKMTPGVMDVFKEFIREGDVDVKKLRSLGSDSVPATAESFLRGFIAASLTFAYESGKLGNLLKGIKPDAVPGVIGALTVIAISTIKDFVNMRQGKITQQEFMFNFMKASFVSGCAVGMGVALQSLIPALPIAYFLGNIVGTLVGSLAFTVADNLFMALCVKNGYTMFGLVDQDYSLPDDLLKELGVDWSQVDTFYMDSVDINEVEIDETTLDETPMCCIRMLRRGVFSIHHVGYIYE